MDVVEAEAEVDAEAPQDGDAAVVVEGVRKTYGPVVAVADLSLSLMRGEIVCLLGPSGAGKSTLLNLMTGLIRPDTGRIVFDGRDVTDVPPERRRVGAVFQSFALFPHMTVFDNVAFGLRCQKVPRAEVRERVGDQLQAVGLGDKSRRRPHELSGGERQRVAFARALVTRPNVLALDEPFGSLDVQLRGSLRAAVRRLVRRSNVPAILITHDRDDAFGVADKVGIIRSGRLLQLGSLSEVYDRPRNAFVARFMGDANFIVFEGGSIRRAQLGEASTMVRPEHLRLVRPGEGRLEGSYLGTRPAGHLRRCFIEVDGVTLRVSQIGEGDAISYSTGDLVSLTWDDRHGHALEADPDDIEVNRDDTFEPSEAR